MSKFLTAAYEVLRATQRPMSPEDLVAEALRRGLLATTGRTPVATMRARLSTELLRNRERSVFVRVDQNVFALRESRHIYGEYRAERHKGALFDEEIVVVDQSELPPELLDGAFVKSSSNADALFRRWHTLPRKVAERRYDVVQLVSAFVVQRNRKILTHRRSKRLPEARLHGYRSLMFGGHLNPDDMPSLFSLAVPEQSEPFLLRELHEELVLKPGNIHGVTFWGLLYDPSTEVSSQHLAIVYDVELRSLHFEIGERGFLTDPKFETLNSIASHLADFENWSVTIARQKALLWKEQSF